MIDGIVRALLAAHPTEISLDQIGEAVGVKAVTPEEIDRIIEALEKAGRKVSGPEGGGGEARLKQVLDAARTLTRELGQKPTVPQIAERAGLTDVDVRHALALAKVIQR